MDIRGLTAQHARFDVSAGDVELSRFTGGLDVDLSAGRFYAGIDRLQNDITVDMSAGDVELDLPRQADFQLAAHVSAGQLTNEFDSEHEDRRYGTYGAGTYSIKLDVSAGNAHIY
jgi:lia operon protein LiaG